MPFTFERLGVAGLVAARPRVFGDSRGYFFESYNEREFLDAGLPMRFVQDNQSRSHKGVLRGLHYQKTHPQGKLVRVIFGEVFDVAVDLRSGSATFGEWAGIVLTGESQNQLYVPPGFAHGFMVLSDEAVFAYKCTDFYHPEDEGGIRWDDPIIAIDWPMASVEPELSAKDLALSPFEPGRGYFRADGSAL
jgi:dTDP-4-dehydrorhamnose 3,5-epimerase